MEIAFVGARMFILRVDDCGWTPEKNPDKGLEYFQEWRKSIGLDQHPFPVYYGFIPEMVGKEEATWLRDNLSPVEHVSVHGWDHRRGARVTPTEMTVARERFKRNDGTRPDTYIAPFNAYDYRTLRDWKEAGGSVFFGGFAPDTQLGDMPTMREGVLHLPATQAIYDRACPLLQELPSWENLYCPLVVTLHCTWDWQNLAAIAPLGEYLRGKCVEVGAVEDWLVRSTPHLNGLTSPHYLAYSWVLKQLPSFRKVLDFGSRYSVLPSLLTLHGHRVMAFDRDIAVGRHQFQISRDYKVALEGVVIGGELSKSLMDTDAVTSCWAIQHNPVEEQERIVRTISENLPSDGRLLLVQNYTPETHHWTNRPDPMWVLGEADIRRVLVEPSGMELVNKTYFRYTHASTEGDYCDQSMANAVCLHLRKA
jgi:SAM-dependent methyltransferase